MPLLTELQRNSCNGPSTNISPLTGLGPLFSSLTSLHARRRRNPAKKSYSIGAGTSSSDVLVPAAKSIGQACGRGRCPFGIYGKGTRMNSTLRHGSSEFVLIDVNSWFELPHGESRLRAANRQRGPGAEVTGGRIGGERQLKRPPGIIIFEPGRPMDKVGGGLNDVRLFDFRRKQQFTRHACGESQLQDAAQGPVGIQMGRGRRSDKDTRQRQWPTHDYPATQWR